MKQRRTKAQRKAIAESALLYIILTLVAALVITIGVYQIIQRQKESGPIQLCRDSFIAAKLFDKTRLAKLNIDCSLQEKAIKEKTAEEEMRQVAKLLTDCWYKNLKNENVIGRRYFLALDWPNPDQKFCLVCSEFSVSKQFSGIDFLTYLSKQMPVQDKRDPDGRSGQETYFDYLDTGWPATGDSTDGRQFLVRTDGPNTLVHRSVGYGPFKSAYEFTFSPGAKYYAIAYSWSTKETMKEGEEKPYNHVFLLQDWTLPNLDCDVTHIQREE
ncbi:hypothetical protein HY642_00900 [Candidatus Woesearchaeota archaeon]|nr:hypothetical protein [Candidatus Woesearchaeota archaeon]